MAYDEEWDEDENDELPESFDDDDLSLDIPFEEDDLPLDDLPLEDVDDPFDQKRGGFGDAGKYDDGDYEYNDEDDEEFYE
ncbi:MAG: hypothetical protein LBQ52_04300 [Helicobacteraceae bacterium]|jgi:hypothetical protein|nr:hypothetical protein [Helicobacteraceae bacterium]